GISPSPPELQRGLVVARLHQVSAALQKYRGEVFKSYPYPLEFRVNVFLDYLELGLKKAKLDVIDSHVLINLVCRILFPHLSVVRFVRIRLISCTDTYCILNVWSTCSKGLAIPGIYLLLKLSVSQETFQPIEPDHISRNLIFPVMPDGSLLNPAAINIL
ncbi:hypothetical protein AKJ16_DCAP12771, partial [Drosera capensis]